ncbi:MAG: hypothetical protein GVY28_08720 [Alphaproteobacteria bacterium]|jgi:rubredoxin|nr:hypothetical protein [Alphaproteobacteria bacterium]
MSLIPVRGAATRRVFVQTLFGLVTVTATAGTLSVATRASATAASDLPVFRCPEEECGYLYDPAFGVPEQDIPPGVAFEDLPDDWECPECGSEKIYW